MIRKMLLWWMLALTVVGSPAWADKAGQAQGLALAAQANLPRSITAEALGASVNAPASVITGAIQKALDKARAAGGGVVTLLTPGVYSVNATLTICSDTELDLGPQTTLRLSASVNAPLMKNCNWNSPVISVASITPNLDSNSRYIVTVSAPSHGFSVNDYVLIKGDTTQQYVGVYRVSSVVDTNTFQFILGSSVALTAGAGSMTSAKADGNITLRGGTLDYNFSQNGGSGLQLMLTTFNKVGNFSVYKQKAVDARKYAYYVGNGFGIRFDDIILNTNSDGIHLMGPVRDIVVNNVNGRTGDDFIAYTATNGGGYNQYDLPDNNGEIINFSASNIKAVSAINIFGFYPGQGYTARGIKLTNITTTPLTQRAVTMATVAGTSATVEDFNINGLYGNTAFDFLAIGKGTDAITANNVSIRELRPDAFKKGDYVTVSGGSVLGNIDVSNSTFKWDTSVAGNGIDSGNLGVVLRAGMRNITTETTGTSVSTARLFFGSAISEMSVTDSFLTGTSFAGIWGATTQNVIPSIWAENLRIGGPIGNGSQGIYSLMQVPSSFYLTLSRIYTHGTQLLVNPYAAGIAQNLRAHDLRLSSGTTILPPTAFSGTLNLTGDETSCVDITRVARVDGAQVCNNNAAANNGTDGTIPAGMYVGVGTVVGSWHRLGTAGGAGNQY